MLSSLALISPTFSPGLTVIRAILLPRMLRTVALNPPSCSPSAKKAPAVDARESLLGEGIVPESVPDRAVLVGAVETQLLEAMDTFGAVEADGSSTSVKRKVAVSSSSPAAS
mmetsp:Transcript_51724/g.83936  ORF Transcript_51724/g.83936 Transcript_51724/m.83936 type:complete len:112 (-) Transcript_51724:572-907(-)